jgi:hypothetical protein
MVPLSEQPRGFLAGLCDSCVHQQRVPNTRGSVFSLCLRSRSEPDYPRYPRLPVRQCAGHQPRKDN